MATAKAHGGKPAEARSPWRSPLLQSAPRSLNLSIAQTGYLFLTALLRDLAKPSLHRLTGYCARPSALIGRGREAPGRMRLDIRRGSIRDSRHRHCRESGRSAARIVAAAKALQTLLFRFISKAFSPSNTPRPPVSMLCYFIKIWSGDLLGRHPARVSWVLGVETRQRASLQPTNAWEVRGRVSVDSSSSDRSGI